MIANVARASTVIFASACVILSAATMASTPSAVAASSCQVRLGPQPIETGFIVKRTHLTCNTARRIVRDFMRSRAEEGVYSTIKGWRCRWYPPGLSPEPSCRKGRRLTGFYVGT